MGQLSSVEQQKSNPPKNRDVFFCWVREPNQQQKDLTSTSTGQSRGREGVAENGRKEEEEGEVGMKRKGDSLPSGTNRLFLH